LKEYLQDSQKAMNTMNSSTRKKPGFLKKPGFYKRLINRSLNL